MSKVSKRVHSFIRETKEAELYIRKEVYIVHKGN
jgi:hypothetical protein